MSKWEPFVRATEIRAPKEMLDIAKQFGMRPSESEIWFNNYYQVQVMRDRLEDFIILSIKGRDKQALHDWRDLQRIKNELIGHEHEGVELYPAESRLVDSANQYFMFVLRDPTMRFPFGFSERFVTEEAAYGTQQRPWRKDDKPADLTSIEDYLKRCGKRVPQPA